MTKVFDFVSVFMRERCEAMHAAILGGRTALPSATEHLTDGSAMKIYTCPHCQRKILTKSGQ